MNKEVVGILFESQSDILAGDAPERPSSYHWREQAEIDAVCGALHGLGYQVELIGTLESLLARSPTAPLDFVMNLSVRTESRNRTALAPAILETMGVPYVGADATAKALTLNKDLLKPYLAHLDIPTPPWVTITNPSDIPHTLVWERAVVKPAAEGNSLGVHVIDQSTPMSEISAMVEELLSGFGVPVMIEQLVEGREVCIAVGGEADQSLWGGSEVLTPSGKQMGSAVLDTKAKRAANHQRHYPALDSTQLDAARRSASQFLARIGPVDYASFDFRIDNNDIAMLIDVNLDATLHPERSLARSIVGRGTTYQELIGRIVSRCASNTSRTTN